MDAILFLEVQTEGIKLLFDDFCGRLLKDGKYIQLLLLMEMFKLNYNKKLTPKKT